jgi:hypothetical protein
VIITAAKHVCLVNKDDKLHVQMYSGTYPVIKGYESFTGWFWFATEREVIPANETITGKDETVYFGLVQGHEEELGYFSESELNELIAAGKVWEILPQDLPFSGRR